MIALPPTNKEGECLKCKLTRDSKNKNTCKCPAGLYDKNGKEVKAKKGTVTILEKNE